MVIKSIKHLKFFIVFILVHCLLSIYPTPVLAAKNVIDMEFQTGRDDLRGGKDNLNVIVKFHGRPDLVFKNVNKSKRWKNWSKHKMSKTLPKGLRVSDISGIRLETTFGGGMGGDNWNLYALDVKAVVGSQQCTLLKKQAKPIYRFTGKKRSKYFPFSTKTRKCKNLKSQLIVTFHTGRDDLRGGNDNVDIVLIKNRGKMKRFRNVNRGKRWKNKSVHTVILPLHSSSHTGNIRGIRLETTSRGRVGGDNWNLHKLVVKARIGSGERQLYACHGSPLFRFTGKRHTQDFNFSGTCSSLTNSRREENNYIEMEFFTGDDDLRGDKDNLDVIVKLRGRSDLIFKDINYGRTWGNRSKQIKTEQLPLGIKINDIEGIRLATTFRGGTEGDNWNLDALNVKAVIGDQQCTLLKAKGKPLCRFTGRNRARDFNFSEKTRSCLTRKNTLIVKVLTGDDDLRGGSDNVDIILIKHSGEQKRYPNVNKGRRLSFVDGYKAVALPLHPSTQFEDIKGIRLETTFRGIVDGDNWDLGGLIVKAIIGGKVKELYDCNGKPLFRFTGRQRTREFNFSTKCSVYVDEYPYSKLKNILTVTFGTGDDDLRGKSDNVDVVLIKRKGKQKRYSNVNEGRRLENNSERAIALPLDPSTRFEDIRGIRLETTFTGGSSGDNWNLDRLAVKARIGKETKELYNCRDKPLFRFTGRQRKRSFNFSENCSSYTTIPKNNIEMVFTTGDDDLRGGKDNLNVVLKLRGRSPLIFKNVNHGRTWRNRTRNKVRRSLPRGIRIDDIVGIRLETTTNYGMNCDNWNLDALNVKVVVGGQQCTLLNIEGKPLCRFTGEISSKNFNLSAKKSACQTLKNALIVRFTTGYDGLRGSDDNVDIVLIKRSGKPKRYPNVNKGQRWIKGSINAVSLPLHPSTRIKDIQGIRLVTTSRGNVSRDNWELRRLTVEASMEGKNKRLYTCTGSPLFRFTGRQRTRDFYFWQNCSSNAAIPVNVIDMEFYTGNDDLRGNNDNLNVVVKFRGRPPLTFKNINKGKKWKNRSKHTVSKRLPKGLRISDIAGIRLETTFSGGMSADNWNLDALNVRVVVGNQQCTLLKAKGKPLYRFTRKNHTRNFNFSAKNRSCRKLKNELIVSLYTGRDDLRGGKDNVDIAVIYPNGLQKRFSNVNKGKRWKKYSIHTITLPLGATTQFRDVRGIRLETTFRGGTGGDNWDLKKLVVKARIGSGERKLYWRQGFPLFRFTGIKRSKSFLFSSR